LAGTLAGPNLPTSNRIHYQNFVVVKCPGQDSNLHTFNGASPSSWCVYQFHHLGFYSAKLKIKLDFQMPITGFNDYNKIELL
jgi:hypothetical protein